MNGTLSATPWPVNVLNTTYSVIVLLTWEQISEEGDRPVSFRAECKSQFHNSTVTLSVTDHDNRSFTTPIGGLLPSTSYNCCVSAVYDTMHTSEGACTLVETTNFSTTTTGSHSSTTIPQTEFQTTTLFPVTAEANVCALSSTHPLVIGGVLGSVVTVLLILVIVMCICVLRFRASAKNNAR